MPDTKRALLIFIEYFLPGYKFGGPIQSVANIINLLKEEYDISLVTRDRDQGDSQSYPGFTLNEWIQKDGYRIQYLSPQMLTLNTINQLLVQKPYNFIYTNSLLSNFTRLLLIANWFSPFRLIIAPRGELHPGAVRLKLYKKIPYFILVKLLASHSLSWHATDEEELALIEQRFGMRAKNKIYLAPAIPRSLPLRPVYVKQKDHLKLIFVARLARNKGLDFLLHVLEAVKEGTILLTIYGPAVDPTYWQDCEKIIAGLPANILVDYRGYLPHSSLEQELQQFDFLVMPTHGENFGHIIFESLSSGLPVLISDKTPWRNLSQIQAGFDIPLVKKLWINKLIECIKLDNNQHNDMVKAAHRLSVQYIQSKSFMIKYKNLFS